MNESTTPLLVSDRLWAMRYVFEAFPQGAHDHEANCQRFAYEVLRENGRAISDLRSSALMADTRETVSVTALEPLDLVLFNATTDAWGAHVAVYAGEDRLLHLCREVGAPTVWTLAEFAERPRYRYRIGAKRVLRVGG